MPQRAFVVLFAINTVLGVVRSQPEQLRSPAAPGDTGRGNGSAPEPGGPDTNPREWMDRMRSLSSGRDLHGSAPAPLTDSAFQESEASVSLEVLRTLLAFYRPALTPRFVDALPRALVCLLSGGQNCGAEADLTRALSAQAEAPLRAIVAQVQKGSCAMSWSSTRTPDAFDAGGSTLSKLASLQDVLVSALRDLPHYVPEYVLSGWGLFADVTLPPLTKYISGVIVSAFRKPADYVKSALQLVVGAPDLDHAEQCRQGDLKQLIIWGMNHNLSWSFSDSILDIFLAPETPVCSYPSLDCQSTHSVLFTRTLRWAAESPVGLPQCDQQHLSNFADTFCAELLSVDPQSSDWLHSFCKALSALNTTEMELVWKNGCHFASLLLSPFLNKSACSGYSIPWLETEEPRSSLSLNQLVCNYANWSNGSHVDPALVALCSDNDQKEFVRVVCHNVTLILLLAADANNAWLWNFCTNFSTSSLVDLYCTYETWRLNMVDSALVSFCWDQDHDRLQRMLCDDLDFYMRFFAHSQNSWLLLDCSNLEPPTSLDISNGVPSLCRYSEWSQPALLTMDALQMCVLHDDLGFTEAVCSNATFLKAVLQNKMNAWVSDHCAVALKSTPTETTAAVSIKDWCSYADWGVKAVDPSVVGFCWQYDQVTFTKNVCCIMSVYEKLILDPQNEWLMTACSDKEMLDVLPQVCRYDEWSRPTIVDMTDLALCTELDPQNFTQKVCASATVLQNLLANLDNTWLLQYCANRSGGSSRDGDSQVGFRLDKLCQYESWTVMIPDTDLLSMCWNYDQVSFISSICTDFTLLSLISQEPSSMWVSTVCSTYKNTSNGNTKNNTNTSAKSNNTNSCPARDIVQSLKWSCNKDFSAACQPGASQTLGLQLILRCAMDILYTHIGVHLTDEVSALVAQVTKELVVVLLALEERHLTSLRVTENIRLSVLQSVMLYLEQETNFNSKRVLLQCFGKVLTSLMQTGRDVTSDGYFLIKEYFRIPLPSLGAVLIAADITTVRQILLYFNRNKDTLQLSADYLQTMVTVFFHTQLVGDPSLFPDLAALLSEASPADILALPPLQNNVDVIKTINSKINSLSIEQRRAFGKWFSQSTNFLNTTARAPSFIIDVGNLITYIPFSSFQHLSPTQLLNGLDVILRNPVTPVQKQFAAQAIVEAFTNLTADNFRRLGNLICLAHPKDLLVYRNTEAFAVIQDSVRACVSQGLRVPSDMISSLFLNSSELKVPTSLSSERVRQLADFLPWLGADFLRQLTPSQLLPALPKLATVPFTPAQAREIVSKVLSNMSLEVAGQLSGLGSLVSGVMVETLRALPTKTLLSALPNITLHDISNPQANAITTKLWDSQMVSGWMDQMEPLLSRTPLLSVLPRLTVLVSNRTSGQKHPWNTQQAKALFKEATKNKAKLSTAEFLDLGTIAQGVNCKTLRQLFLAQPTSSSMRNILAFLREQPVLLHTSLKRCIIEELYQFAFFFELLGELGSQIALELSVSSIKKFPVTMMDTLRQMIVNDPSHFLRLPSIKQTLLVDKMTQRLSMYTGQYTEKEFRSLGIMATFVVDEVFLQLDRSFFVENLELFRGYCYNSSKKEIVAQFLQEPSTFGSVKNWKSETLEQVGRFLFFLSKEAIQLINTTLMTQERIERLFLSQQEWEAGEVGRLCIQGTDQAELQRMFERQQFVLQFFLGFLRPGQLSFALVPSCENLHTTQPSAWTVDSLSGMPADAFARCLELIGQDPFLTQYELAQLLSKVKKIYGPVSSFSPSVIAQLGRIALRLSDDELRLLNLSDLSSIATLGAVDGWSPRQLSILFSSMLNSTKLSPNQLDSSTLVALGHVVCGIKTSDMQNLKAVEFSKAVLWLGRLRLLCSEEQLQVLVGLLSNSLAFGHIGSWGPEVFIEIGSFTAGLPDIAMSALVKDQIEGITPLAISLIPDKKFAVAFNQAQIRTFTYEQAAAVTEAQRAALSTVQQTALSMVLTPWEDKPVDFRDSSSLNVMCFGASGPGRSSAHSLHFWPFLFGLELVMLLLMPLHHLL